MGVMKKWNKLWKFGALAWLASTVSLSGSTYFMDFDSYGNVLAGNPVQYLWDRGTGPGQITDAQRASGTADLNSVLVASDTGTSPHTPNIGGTPIGDLWLDFGIKITVTGSDPLGLFDSHDNFTTVSTSTGDPDLLTGTDVEVNTGGTRKTTAANGEEPLGNLLIIEETPGNGIPDDTGGGGIVRFELDNGTTKFGGSAPGDVRGVLDFFLFVDDADLDVTLFFANESDDSAAGSRLVYNNTIPGDNAILSLHHDVSNPFPASDFDVQNDLLAPSGQYLDYVEVDFNSSGGIGGIQFSFLSTVPEPSAGALGGLFFGLMGSGWVLRRRRTHQDISPSR